MSEAIGFLLARVIANSLWKPSSNHEIARFHTSRGSKMSCDAENALTVGHVLSIRNSRFRRLRQQYAHALLTGRAPMMVGPLSVGK